MMDFNERVIPGVSSNFMFKEAQARYEFASKYIKPGIYILDLGSGTGYGDSLMAKAGATVLGIDIDAEAVKFAEKKYGGPNVKFQKGDVLKIKLPKESLDMIVSFEVIEHLKNPAAYLNNLSSFLEKDGVFIMSTPNAKVVSPNGGVGSPYHEKEFNYDELKSLLLRRFGEVEIYGQSKSKKALLAWKDFLISQEARESVAASDKLGLRKLIPKGIKEKIWKHLGNLAGRKTQEYLNISDFPISLKSVKLAYYFIAVCKSPKSR